MSKRAGPIDGTSADDCRWFLRSARLGLQLSRAGQSLEAPTAAGGAMIIVPHGRVAVRLGIHHRIQLGILISHEMIRLAD